MADFDLVRDHTIYSCVVGSRAYGLAGKSSDTDRRGVFVAPTPLFWSLDKPPAHIEGPGEEQFSWELERLCQLALQANPTVLECLWSPLVEHIDDTGRELIALRGGFLSRRLSDTYGSYARDQFKRLETTLVDVETHRAELLAVKNGERSWEEVQAWAARLSSDLETASRITTLPPEPDRLAVNDFLRRVRLANL